MDSSSNSHGFQKERRLFLALLLLLLVLVGQPRPLDFLHMDAKHEAACSRQFNVKSNQTSFRSTAFFEHGKEEEEEEEDRNTSSSSSPSS
jgi:hypothetical protein